jgi:hypothetical protein
MGWRNGCARHILLVRHITRATADDGRWRWVWAALGAEPEQIDERMKRTSFVKGLGAAAIGAALVASPAAGQTATQLVRMEIRPINQLAVIGTTSFTIAASKGAVKPGVTTAAASYAITTNEENRRITVAIDEALPEGVTLRMRMDAPEGAQSLDAVTLSTSPQTAVAGISRLNARELGIAYELVTGTGVVVPAKTTRTVRVTLVSGT